jgi:hypothetical protein
VAINFTWRITKYNPNFRDNRGNYLKEEWNSISDVGNLISDSGVRISIQDYILVEERYVKAIFNIMNCLNIQKLAVNGLEKWDDTLDTSDFSLLYSDKMKRLYNEIKDGIWIDREQVSDICRLILREKIWCKLNCDGRMYVHFGHDFYMFIGSEKRCSDTIGNIKKSGLYVEDFISPINDEN